MEFYGLNRLISCSNIDVVEPENIITSTTAATSSATFHCPDDDDDDDHMLRFETEAMGSTAEVSDLIKAQIATHPRYPDVVAAFIECQKVEY